MVLNVMIIWNYRIEQGVDVSHEGFTIADSAQGRRLKFRVIYQHSIFSSSNCLNDLNVCFPGGQMTETGRTRSFRKSLYRVGL